MNLEQFLQQFFATLPRYHHALQSVRGGLTNLRSGDLRKWEEVPKDG